jgi:hypothetical protein
MPNRRPDRASSLGSAGRRRRSPPVRRTPAIVRWPGKVAAGTVTDEILRAVDWFPTLAELVGDSRRVPDDRPIDGVGAWAFLLGQSTTTGRDHVIYFGSDAAVMSVKWRTVKIRSPSLRKHQRPNSQAPMATDLRPHRRSRRGMGPDRKASRLRLDAEPRCGAAGRAPAQRRPLPEHQAWPRLQRIRLTIAPGYQQLPCAAILSALKPYCWIRLSLTKDKPWATTCANRPMRD